jgi:predicted ABC-type ATPase
LTAQPVVVVLAGPNGAGKSTAAPALLRDAVGVSEFVNADVIAGGLSAFNSEDTAMAAGRVMLSRIKALAAKRVSFAFETTMASRSFAPWLRQLKSDGFSIHIVFLWLPSAELAERRVAERVALGGHDVPTGTIRRRHRAGLRNFFALYKPLASSWRLYDASGPTPELIAGQVDRARLQVYDRNKWARVKAQGKP